LVIRRGVQVYLNVWKESEIHMKRDLDIYAKRPRYTWIETLKRCHIPKTLPRFEVNNCTKKDIDVYEKRPRHIWNETHIHLHMKRDLGVEMSYNKDSSNIFDWLGVQVNNYTKKDMRMYEKRPGYIYEMRSTHTYIWKET